MKQALVVIIPGQDMINVASIGGIVSKNFSATRTEPAVQDTLTEIKLLAKKHHTKFLCTTSLKIFKLVRPILEGTANDNYGTVLEFPGFDNETLRIVLLPSLKTQHTMNEGTFLLEHYLSKLANGGAMKKDPFRWEFVTPSTLNSVADKLNESFLIAVDIETSRDGLRITSCSWTAGFITPSGVVHTNTYVVRCSNPDYPFCIDAIRVLNSTTPPKVMQNGQYDATYFCRFDAPLRNWLYDTYNFMHCLFPELPKDLPYMSSFFLDNYIYWKDEAANNLYEYNAKDTHNTFWLWLGQIAYAPEYAIKNYLMEFPVVFPSLTCGLEGFKADKDKEAILHKEATIKRDTARERLAYLINEPNFNPGSTNQVIEMFFALKHRPLVNPKAKPKKGKNAGKPSYSSDAKETQRFKESNVIFEPIADLITEYREAAKAVSTYFEIDMLNDRLMYQLDPAGTDSGRLASKSSNFWCGTQIQNIPPYARAMYLADDGYILGAVDKAQSESYCTGYIAQEPKLIHVVTTSPDFHCQNASMFFGIPFEELFDVRTGKKLNKLLRDIAKKVNHGANYNMGAGVLLTTMGTKFVIAAKQLLKLPAPWTLLRVCEYLLECFDKAYPRIRGAWQLELTKEVITTGKLSLECGWTRRTFLKPHKSKMDLNTVISHKPQCQSVLLVNKAFVKIWWELQIKRWPGKFRLKAQVHDEIVFQATPDIMDEALQLVADMMVIPTKICGKIMTIPSTKISGLYWSELKD